MYKKLLVLFLVMFVSLKAYAENVWINDSRTLFQSNKATIYAVNIRTFNALDKNGNGIIEEEKGEVRGSFLNAIDRLDELSKYGVNTIHLLPITPVGRKKALGTAGSLYSVASFAALNPQLKDENSNLSILEQARLFVDACHKRKIRVIVDLPPCGSYDLYLRKPSLFAIEKNVYSIIPMDWTDVRVLNAGDNNNLNKEVLTHYQRFIDMVIDIGADGVFASQASAKPYSFWKTLIDDTRKIHSEFVFVTNSSSKDVRISNAVAFTPYNKLLEAGFDAYFGDYAGLKDWKTSNDLFKQIFKDKNLISKFSVKKSTIGAFSTINDLSPVLVSQNNKYSIMIAWLNSTLPMNSYYVDGFASGADYIYPLANKKAIKSYTDDNYYFMHHGKFDIFNFSAKPQGKDNDITQEFVRANSLKNLMSDVMPNSNFVRLSTTNPEVFAYARSDNNRTLIVVGNLNYEKSKNVKVHVPRLKKDSLMMPIRMSEFPVVKKGNMTLTLNPAEVQVFLLSDFSIK